MSRRRPREKRGVLPARSEIRRDDGAVTKFMNSIMYQGKKSVAERIVYGALDHASRSGLAAIRWK